MLKLIKIFLLFICSASVANATVFTADQISKIQKIMGYDANAQITGQNIPLEQAEAIGSAKRQQIHDEEQSYECTKDHCEVGHTFSIPATTSRETEIEKAGFIKDESGFEQNNKGYLDKAMANIKEAKNKFDFLSGGYTDCKPIIETTTNSSEQTCDEYFDVKHNACFPQQVVEIDSKYTYQCSKKREIKEKICTDTITSLKCKQSGECDSGGIVLKSLASDMKWAYNYPTLTLGTIADNYWQAGCGRFIRSTSFEVKNLRLIQEFRIVDVGYDDYLRITINGNPVFNGPFGGEKLEIKNYGWISIIDTGTGGTHGCELETNRYTATNIDLIPYLKEGTNELIMEVIVAGLGEGWARIKTKQHCCTEWEETREEKCIFV